MSVVENFDINSIANEQRIRLDAAWDKTMQHFKNLIVTQARTTHSYNNQTHQLTDTTDATYINHVKTLTIFAPAQSTNNKYYGHYVLAHYNENWLKDAVDFYQEDIGEFFMKEVTK